MILKFHYIRSWSTGVTTYTCFFYWQNLVTHFVDLSRLSHFQRSNPWIPSPERVRAWHEPSLSSMMWPRKETMHLGFAQPSEWIWFKIHGGFAENWVSVMKSVYPKHVLFRDVHGFCVWQWFDLWMVHGYTLFADRAICFPSPGYSNLKGPQLIFDIYASSVRGMPITDFAKTKPAWAY